MFNLHNPCTVCGICCRGETNRGGVSGGRQYLLPQQERVIARWRRIALKVRLRGMIINVQDKMINSMLLGYHAALGR